MFTLAVRYFDLGHIDLHTASAPQHARTKDRIDSILAQTMGCPAKRASINAKGKAGTAKSVWPVETRTGKTTVTAANFRAQFAQSSPPQSRASVTRFPHPRFPVSTMR